MVWFELPKSTVATLGAPPVVKLQEYGESATPAALATGEVRLAV
jgi:hypothetical protein